VNMPLIPPDCMSRHLLFRAFNFIRKKNDVFGTVTDIVNVHNYSTWVRTEMSYVQITKKDLYELIY
jgi:hypothetical protein